MASFKFYSDTAYRNFLDDVYEMVRDDSENVEDEINLEAEIPNHYVEVYPEITEIALGYGGEELNTGDYYGQ